MVLLSDSGDDGANGDGGIPSPSATAAAAVRSMCDELSNILAAGDSSQGQRGSDGHHAGPIMLDVVRLFVCLVADRRADRQLMEMVAARAGEKGEKAPSAEEEGSSWVERRLIALMGRGQGWQIGQEGRHDCGWLDTRLALSVAGALQNMSRRHADPRRTCHLLWLWLDLLLWRDTSELRGDGGTARTVGVAVDTLRQHMLHSQEGRQHAASLCGMVIDGMLMHNDCPETAANVDAIVDRMQQYGLPMQQHIVVSVVNKSSHVPPRSKWRVMQRAPVELVNSVLVDRVLLDCQIAKDWTTARQVIQFAHSHSLIDAAIAFRILDITISIGHLLEAKKIFDSLAPEIKWHGTVLFKMLSISVHKRERKWVLYLVREVLQRSRLLHNGSWPTAFFETEFQKRGFEIMHERLLAACEEWGRKEKDGPIADLAAGWCAFYEDQMERFGKHAKQAKTKSKMGRQE